MSRRDLEARLANTTWSCPPADVPMSTCWCGGAWMDTDIGQDSHEVVMGHRPAKKNAAPAENGGAAVSHDEAAMCAGGPADEGEPPIRGDPTTDPRQNDDNDE